MRTGNRLPQKNARKLGMCTASSVERRYVTLHCKLTVDRVESINSDNNKKRNKAVDSLEKRNKL